MIYTFLIVAQGRKLAELSRIRTISAYGRTEAEARAHLAGLPLVFAGCRPAGQGGGSMSRLATIPKDTSVEAAKGEISRNNERLASLGYGVKAIGELLFTVADAGELGKETATCTGYLLDELGGVISDTLNMNTMLSIHIEAAEQEGRK